MAKILPGCECTRNVTNVTPNFAALDLGFTTLNYYPGIYDLFISAEGFSPACKKIEVDAHYLRLSPAEGK